MAQRALTPGNAAYCSECGAETPPDAKTCARCGEPFEGTMQAVLCPICNSINPAASTECLNCNAKFPEAGLDEAPPPTGPESPEEAYLRKILQLSREKARNRGGSGPGAGGEPASSLEADRAEGQTEESLWKLAEPFDRMLERRKQRLEQMEALIERAQTRMKAFGQLKERESDFVRREDEFRTVMNRVHEREREIEKREELMRDKARLLDERHHALSEAEVDLERRRWELEQKVGAARTPSKEEPTPVTIKSDQELGALQSRMVQLEEQMERLAVERNQLMEQQKELLNMKGDLKVVMKDIDELLWGSAEGQDPRVREIREVRALRENPRTAPAAVIADGTAREGPEIPRGQ